MRLPTECNLSSKDLTTTDDSIDYIACSSKCLNDLNNIELCSCHQNNEIGKKMSFFVASWHETLCVRVHSLISFHVSVGGCWKLQHWCIYSILLFREMMSKYCSCCSCWCWCDEYYFVSAMNEKKNVDVSLEENVWIIDIVLIEIRKE